MNMNITHNDEKEEYRKIAIYKLQKPELRNGYNEETSRTSFFLYTIV